jgi:hypothetical protein
MKPLLQFLAPLIGPPRGSSITTNPEEGDVVHALADVREEVAHVLAALPVLLELPAGLYDAAYVLVPPAAEGLDLDGLVVHPVHVRLVIKGVYLAGAAVHVEEDNRFGAALLVGRLDGEGVLVGERSSPIGGMGLAPEEAVFAEQPGESRACKSGPDFPQELPPRPPAGGTGYSSLLVSHVDSSSPYLTSVQIHKLVQVQGDEAE